MSELACSQLSAHTESLVRMISVLLIPAQLPPALLLDCFCFCCCCCCQFVLLLYVVCTHVVTPWHTPPYLVANLESVWCTLLGDLDDELLIHYAVLDTAAAAAWSGMA
jgi:hypothetical protein